MHLGNFSEPLLIFGGPYSNLQALQALKAQAEFHEIPPSHVICTGDIVAYCGQPDETVELIREWGIHVLMGNCEASFANKAEDCGCGFEEGSSCDLLSVQWFQFAKAKLKDEQRQWFARLPRSLTLRFLNKPIEFVHGSVSSINQFIFASSDHSVFLAEMQQSQADIIIGGHCGIPFSRTIQQQLWHNAGAIGMPANDGSTQTWYSLLSGEEEGIRIDTFALDYDYRQAANTMVQAGLDNGYAEALISGLWPSMDVLPPDEKNQRGKALKPFSTYFSL